MTGKTIPLSVRVSMEDAEYISSLDIPGAVTPSEKLRAIIGNARQRSRGFTDYEGCLKNLGELITPLSLTLKGLEHQVGERSELVEKLLGWNKETLAFLLASVPQEVDTAPEEIREALEALEQGLADRTFSLVVEVLRMGITSKSQCYDPTVISERLDQILEIVAVIRSARS